MAYNDSKATIIILKCVGVFVAAVFIFGLLTRQGRDYDISILEDNSDIQNVRSLTLTSQDITDLTPISHLSFLEHLDISNTQVTDLSPLAGLIRLQTLNLAYCGVQDISVLANHSFLREIDVSTGRKNKLHLCFRPLVSNFR